MPAKLTNGNIIHLKHVGSGKNVRITAEGVLEANGGEGKWAKFTVHRDPQNHVSFQNVGNPNHWIRTMPNGDTDGKGQGGKHCKYIIGNCNPHCFTSIHGGNLGFVNSGDVKQAENTGNGIHGQFEVIVVSHA